MSSPLERIKAVARSYRAAWIRVQGSDQEVHLAGADPVYERRSEAERMFNESACERLISSNRQYQDEHGYYLPVLAYLLNETRRERDEAREKLRVLGLAIVDEAIRGGVS